MLQNLSIFKLIVNGFVGQKIIFSVFVGLCIITRHKFVIDRNTLGFAGYQFASLGGNQYNTI